MISRATTPPIRLALIIAAAASGCAALSDQPASVRDGVLTTPDGRPLYVYKKDAPSQSHCYDFCAVRWSAYSAPGQRPASSDFATILRAEGIWQWTYKGQPLYVRAAGPGDPDDQGLWSPARAIP